MGIVKFIIDIKDLASNKIGQIGNATSNLYAKFNQLNVEYTKNNQFSQNSITGLKSKIDRLIDNRNASTSITRIRSYNGEIRQLQSELKKLENLPPLSFRQRLLQATDSFSGFLKTGGQLFIITKGLQAIGAAISSGINMEQTQISFEVMLKSAEKAKTTLAGLNEFANITPFDNAEVIKAGKILLTASIPAEKLNDELRKVGDVASGANVPLNEMASIYAKAMNKGRVQAEELNQLAERGVPILDTFANMFGITKQEVLKLGEQGKLSADLLSKAFDQMTGKGGTFENMMERQSKTVGGRISTLVGNLQAVGIKLGTILLPVIGAVVDFGIKLVEGLAPVGAALMNIVDSFKPLWDAIINLLSIINPFKGEMGIMGSILTVIAKLFNVLAYITGLFAEGLSIIINLFAENKVLLIGLAAATAIYLLWKKKAIIAEKLHQLAVIGTGNVFTGLKAIMAANPFGAVLIGVSLLIAGIKRLISHFNYTKKAIQEVKNKAAEYAAEEQVNLKKLFDRLQQTNPKSKERLELVKKLKEQYPELNKQQIEELKTATDLTGVYNALTKAIIAKALARAREESIAEAMRKNFEIDARQAMIKDETRSTDTDLLNAGKAVRNDITGILNAASYFDDNTKKAKEFANLQEEKDNNQKFIDAAIKLVDTDIKVNADVSVKGSDVDPNKLGNSNAGNDITNTANSTLSGGSKPTNIYVNLNNLVENIVVNSTVKESIDNIKGQMVEAFLQVLNSANVMARQ